MASSSDLNLKIKNVKQISAARYNLMLCFYFQPFILVFQKNWVYSVLLLKNYESLFSLTLPS